MNIAEHKHNKHKHNKA